MATYPQNLWISPTNKSEKIREFRIAISKKMSYGLQDGVVQIFMDKKLITTCEAVKKINND
jgi:hypothetical protein